MKTEIPTCRIQYMMIIHLKQIKLISVHGFSAIFLWHFFSLALFLLLSLFLFVRFPILLYISVRIQISIQRSKVFSKQFFQCIEGVSKAIDNRTTRRKYKEKKVSCMFFFFDMSPLVNFKTHMLIDYMSMDICFDACSAHGIFQL